MTKNEFETLLKEAGFKTKKEFAEALNIKTSTVFNLFEADGKAGSRYRTAHCFAFLKWAVMAHKLDKINELRAENTELEQEIERLKNEKKGQKNDQ